MAGPLASVLVVQRRMPHYRVKFFEALRTELPNVGCELTLAYGRPTSAEARKGDSAEIDWAKQLPTSYFLGGRICWQPFAPWMRGAAVAVLTPENKLVNNIGAQLMQTRTRIVLWGHGANLQGDPTSVRERVKRWMARHADWWLGYTEMSRELIARTGFPRERVTILNNAVDTVEMGATLAGLQPASLAEARARWHLKGAHVGVFVGSLYEEKRIDFLLEAALVLRQRIPDFELLILGDGPQAEMVEAFCKAHAWAHPLGMCKGLDKVVALAASRVMLNPGLVGLGILDAFVCGVPMVTTDCGLHSPEVAYLDSGVNGWMTPDTLGDFVDAAAAVLTDDAVHARLQRGCDASAQAYTVENMAKNFARGVRQCLDVLAWR